MTARNHHYVSQCYLRGFVKHRNKPKLFIIDLKKKISFQTPPHNVAVERDFHTVEVDGYPPDVIEQAFSQFEGSLSYALDRIIADRIIKDEDDRLFLLNFIALMAIKNPRHRKRFKESQTQMYNVIMDIITSSPEIWNSQIAKAKATGYIPQESDVTWEQARESLERDEFEVEVPPGYHLSIELEVFDKVLPTFVDRKWSLLRAPVKSPGFVTSDHPVCLRWSDPQLRSGRYPPGYGMMKTEVLFPISSELAWIGTFEHDERVIDVDENSIGMFNSIIIDFADRQIFAKDSEFIYRSSNDDKTRRGCELLNDRRFADNEPKKCKNPPGN